ncbi:hypothetical protein [Nocardioides sp. NPDC006303]|uniref:hypothetical protein n=1 Tax=Nocardioides sp. NPDC006303 TaxID=3156747 RepID=UPI0033AC8C1A
MCAGAPAERKILVLGYTRASQDELEQRIKAAAPFKRSIEVCGWYTFLLHHIVRPYLPMLYAGHRLAGFNFDGEPVRGRYATGASRFLDSEDRAFKLHLSKLAYDVMTASQGAVIDRLQHIYDEIRIDEVQDLGGYDLDIMSALFSSTIDLHLVGDMRQALLSTNTRDPRLKKYRYGELIHWFRLQEKNQYLTIEERPQTYRSNQTIANFSDTIFAATNQYSPTVSASRESSHHEGLFAVSPQQLAAYLEDFNPLCLRHGANSGTAYDLPYVTFGNAKGRTADHVLICPTAGITEFLATGKPLDGRPACALYIAVTRAKHSVAFIIDEEAPSVLTAWSP